VARPVYLPCTHHKEDDAGGKQGDVYERDEDCVKAEKEDCPSGVQKKVGDKERYPPVPAPADSSLCHTSASASAMHP